MTRQAEGDVNAVDRQIEKLGHIRERWVEGRDLTDDERIRQALTIELLDAAIQDLVRRREEMKSASP